METIERDVIRLLLDLARSRYFGKYRGTVIDNADATRKGRVKVHVPAVLGGLHVWAMPCVPYAGDGVGFLAIPAAGAGVWVEFEGGDPSFPIWVGCFWAHNEAPEQADPDVKEWKSEQLVVRLDDANAELKIAADDGASVTITTEAATEAGDTKHTVSPGGVVGEVGAQKTELTAGSFSVNSGALQVI